MSNTARGSRASGSAQQPSTSNQPSTSQLPSTSQQPTLQPTPLLPTASLVSLTRHSSHHNSPVLTTRAPSPIPAGNQQNTTNTNNQFYNSSSRSYYNIPILKDELNTYQGFDHIDDKWPDNHILAPFRLCDLSTNPDKIMIKDLKKKLISAYQTWRKGNKIPRIYPNPSEWSNIPSDITDALDGALHLDRVRGVDSSGNFKVRYFINYGRHETFTEAINDHATMYRYVYHYCSKTQMGYSFTY